MARGRWASRSSANASARRPRKSSRPRPASACSASVHWDAPSRCRTPPDEVWMVAGGVGLAPFWTVAETLAARGETHPLLRRAPRRRPVLPRLLRAPWRLARVVHRRRVAWRARPRDVPLERALAGRHGGDRRAPCLRPEPMLAAVARLAARYGCRCEVSVERVMGCGLGGCYSCVVPVKAATAAFTMSARASADPSSMPRTLVWD